MTQLPSNDDGEQCISDDEFIRILDEEEDNTDQLIDSIDLENDDDVLGFLGALLDD